MDKLKIFFEKNRDSFFADEPLPGHMDRFRSKLNAQIPTKKPNLFLVASAAAVAGIIVTAGLSLLINYSSIGLLNQTNIASANLSPEVSQIDDYYKVQVSKKQEVITKLISGDKQPLGNEINKTLNELGEGYKNMLNEISTTPGNDRAAYVLTLHYQAKLDAMEKIIYRLQNVSSITQTY